MTSQKLFATPSLSVRTLRCNGAPRKKLAISTSTLLLCSDDVLPRQPKVPQLLCDSNFFHLRPTAALPKRMPPMAPNLVKLVTALPASARLSSDELKIIFLRRLPLLFRYGMHRHSSFPQRASFANHIDTPFVTYISVICSEVTALSLNIETKMFSKSQFHKACPVHPYFGRCSPAPNDMNYFALLLTTIPGSNHQ